MLKDQLLIISSEDLPELAKVLAPMIKEQISQKDTDPDMTPTQLAKVLPAMTVNMIRTQIREGLYGTRIGPRGKLAAKKSEVLKYNSRRNKR